ncbi:MAG: DUF1566 domain-containing protein [Deltaproteobacteria bacterium]|jgi:hypothetical protein|nr:DUF1566 domain-containing protein [Deltaproteobacteria bacterium]
MRKRKKSILALAIITAFIATALFLPGLVSAGDLEPSAAPGPTMKTLDEIPPTWSQKLDSTDGDPTTGCNSSRFECVMGGEAVLDKETGLVWAKNANIVGTKTWLVAMIYCRTLIIAGRKGWRLPTVEELASLVDTTQNSPVLPSEHPFDNVQSGGHWSSTTFAGDTGEAWNVNMGSGRVGVGLKDFGGGVWPVRGDN